jgi:hypothetical protein
MHQEERFVIESVATAYSGDWKPGADPPDAFLMIADRTIAVEISTLTQHVTDDQGTRSRLCDDIPATRLAKQLDAELKTTVPHGKFVTLALSSPILELRKTKAKLTNEITSLLSGNAELSCRKVSICGNDIEICLSKSPESGGKKIGAVIRNRPSDRNILRNAWYLLEDRIKAKAEKCGHLNFSGSIWLALLNHYFHADADEYRDALKSISVEHPFEKILLVSGDGSVDTLFDQRDDLA